MQVEPRTRRDVAHSTSSATLADVLDRILDKGLVIAGDIKIKLVDIELLTIQIRLLICSVDRAREMGIDWWTTSPYLSSAAEKVASQVDAPGELKSLLEGSASQSVVMSSSQKVAKEPVRRAVVRKSAAAPLRARAKKTKKR